MIAGTLLGENTAKIRNYRMEQNPVYGSQSRLGQTLIKEVIRTMLERGYLRQTEDKYALLKMTGQSDSLLNGEESFLIRHKKEDERQSASGRKTSGKKAEQINALRDEKQMKRLTVKWLTEKLTEEGCLERKFWNGFTRTILTEKGREAGIRAEERTSSKGNPYEVFLYTEKAQRYLVELLKKKGADR